MILREGSRVHVDVSRHENFLSEITVKEQQVQIEADVCNGETLQLWRVFYTGDGELKARDTGVTIDRSTPFTTITMSGRYFIRCCNSSGNSSFNYRTIAKPIEG